MNAVLPFHEALDAVEKLTGDEQDTLIAIMQKRRNEQGRQRIIDEVNTSRNECQQGLARTGNVDDLMKEILA